jgi:hypothetical protein
MSASRVPYKVSDFAKSLDDDQFKIYCKVLEDLKCSDSLVLDLNLFKCGSELETLIPPITRNHMIIHLVMGRNCSDGEKVEAINNLLSSEQTFSDKFLAFPLTNEILILRSHITNSLANFIC